MDKIQLFLIALGANLPSQAGPPEQTLQRALDALQARGARLDAVSRFYHTPCFPAGMGPDYVNAAARIAIEGGPQACLDLLHEVEALYGRERQARWAGRTLDLDLLAAGETVLPDAQVFAHWLALPEEDRIQTAPETLILPHPRLQERAFVLVPLSDIASDWVHPVLNTSVTDMLLALKKKDIHAVKPL